ncbi:hypothetical protein Tco_1103140 [Tanacetum coccineum]
MDEEIENLVEGSENVEENVQVSSLPLRNDDNQTNHETRLEPRSDKESPNVEKIVDISQPVNVIEEEEESTEDDFELKRREKRKNVLTETDTIPSSSTPSSSLPKSNLSDMNRLLSLFKSKSERFKRYKSFFDELQGKYGYLFGYLTTRFLPRRKFNELARYLQDIMMESLPKMDDPHDDAHPGGENSAKRQKTSEHGTFVFGESSSGQDYESKPDDDVVPNEKASQELVDEISQTVDEAKLRKVVDEMLRQQYTSGDEHQDPKASGLPLVNQDLLYLKKRNSRPDKIVLSLHKFLAVIFPDDDIEKRISKWVEKCVKMFNPYARYGVEHWKNSHAKIFYIKNQQALGKPKEEIYSNSKIVQIIKTYWELGHEYKFITEIVARRENGSIVSIIQSDYKNLNKNDIEDMYLLIVNHKVDDFAETGLLWSLSVFIRSIEKYKVFSIVSEPVYDIIYKNNKKEKRVMRHQKVHKFCDATLKRVLKGLKSCNNDVKYGYVTHNLSKEDVEYL